MEGGRGSPARAAARQLQRHTFRRNQEVRSRAVNEVAADRLARSTASRVAEVFGRDPVLLLAMRTGANDWHSAPQS